MTTNTCATCAAFDATNKFCRRRSPGQPQPSNAVSKWPTTTVADWCLEWSAPATPTTTTTGTT